MVTNDQKKIHDPTQSMINITLKAVPDVCLIAGISDEKI